MKGKISLHRLIQVCASLLILLSAPSWAAIELASDETRPVIELSALIVGGIGIFLIGIHFTAEHLERMSGGRFEQWIGRMTQNHFGPVLLGSTLGFITQSGKAVAFILADLVKARLIDSRRAALVIFWGNVGCALIVITSMLSLKVFALFVLGITALGLTFHIPKSLVHTYGALFGLAMIMFGLYLVKDGAAGIASSDWIPDFIANLRGTYLLSFAAGLTLTMMIQSNLAVSMLAIALASSGLLSLQETAAIVIGSQAGTGLLTALFSLHASGRARQVVGYQIAFDAVATVTFSVLFIVEQGFGIPLLFAVLEVLFTKVSTQTVTLVIAYQLLAVIVSMLLHPVLVKQVETRLPPMQSEALAEPEFISSSTQASPELSLLMVELEQLRLLKRLPDYLEAARQTSSSLSDPKDYHAAFKQLSAQINHLLTSISRKNLNTELSESLITITKAQEQLASLEGDLFQITNHVLGYAHEDTAAGLGRNILESVDFLVLTAIDAIEGRDTEDLQMLSSMTQDRGPMMVNLRNAYFAAEQELDTKARSFILDMTLLLENVVKTLSRYGDVLRAHQSLDLSR